MNKTILVPTDFSHYADNALKYAAALAGKEGSKLLILHAIQITYAVSEIPVQMVMEEISMPQRKAESKLKKLCEAISREYKIKCDFICREGLATEVILETSATIRVGLIVMGTQGASGVKEMIFGSNTARVMEESACPVIAVPKGASFHGMRQIVFSTDYRESDLMALKAVAAIAKTFRSRISVLHVADEELTKKTEQELMQRFSGEVARKIKYPNISYRVKYGTLPERVLQEHIEKTKSDLIAMSLLRRNLFQKIFGTSLTRKMAFHSRIPLIAFHYKK